LHEVCHRHKFKRKKGRGVESVKAKSSKNDKLSQVAQISKKDVEVLSISDRRAGESVQKEVCANVIVRPRDLERAGAQRDAMMSESRAALLFGIPFA